MATAAGGPDSPIIEGVSTSMDAGAPRAGARVMITIGRWRHRVGRLVSVNQSDAVVELAEGRVAVAPSMLTVMGEQR